MKAQILSLQENTDQVERQLLLQVTTSRSILTFLKYNSHCYWIFRLLLILTADVCDQGIANCFAFASPSNKDATGPIERFASMMRRGFPLMLESKHAFMTSCTLCFPMIMPLSHLWYSVLNLLGSSMLITFLSSAQQLRWLSHVYGYVWI